ncbi:hypothetical protein G7B40_012120 [Aetokthonos hydrillicola Thurmond2011]|uniref:Uncharacterized protein n=1 Tax=Aetokthonos hydrillicola Thurmond2011 TaxID=2712845 RepID=A0AAP5M926_9CYAN|nr:hypothetical protein [Aetokthonos hydrillicola]MDR9895307.1 hypothetical protein [Aetokthonos hydrillicola Thurmond2011]
MSKILARSDRTIVHGVSKWCDRYNKTSITEEKSAMSITLDLPPKIEALLRQRAESTGQDISQMALAVLTLGLSLDNQDFFEALKGIQQGLDDFEQGKFSSLEDFIAEQNQKYGLSLEA